MLQSNIIFNLAKFQSKSYINHFVLPSEFKRNLVPHQPAPSLGLKNLKVNSPHCNRLSPVKPNHGD